MSSFRRTCFSAALFLTMINGSSALLGETYHSVEYAQAAGNPLLFDAEIPTGSGPFPAAILVHGGGWVRGDRQIDVAPLFGPLNRAGIAWFSIDYRLSSDLLHFGSAIQDVRTAIRYVKSHASEYNVDPDRIALIGESAGGQLAAMAALDPAPGIGVRAVVAFYTPTDLVDLASTSAFIPQQMRDSFKGTPIEKLLMARLAQLSPIQNIGPGAPPFLLIHGTQDRLVPFSQSEAMRDRLKSAGIVCELLPVLGAGHGMRWWDSSHPGEAASYKREMIRWLRQRFGLS